MRNDRYTALGVAGAKLAVDDAQLDLTGIDPGADKHLDGVGVTGTLLWVTLHI
jgi:hypothetical protein